MSALKILIVEDNLTIAQNLEEQLTDFGYTIIGNESNSDAALAVFTKHSPDLVLLDIELKKSKLDGIQLAEAFNKIRKVPIIYLTSFSDKKTKERAKKTQPANYLIKPYNEYQLEIAIDFALSNFSQQKEVIFPLPSTSPKCNFLSLNDFFFVKKHRSYVRINFNDILWLKAGGSAVEIVTEKEKVISYAGIKGFLEQFNHPQIIRVHRSYVVNVLKVIEFDDSHLYIVYQGRKKGIPVGQSYKAQVFQSLYQLKSE